VNQVYWDSMLFIYLLEGNPVFLADVQRLPSHIDARGDRLTTSVFTLGEVLTGPRRVGDAHVVAQVKAYFQSGMISLLPFDAETADRYSILRSSFKLGQADAIHLATAAVAQVDLFITNDKQLLQLQIPGIRFIAGLDGRVYGGTQP
jgi:uncharacterized protein